MCGRFAQFTPIEDLAEEFEIDKNLSDLAPRYNISPGQEISAIVIDESKKIIKLKWGLIPEWAKDPSIASKLINARAETIAEKPSFRNSFKRRRCLILADGFYEWKKKGKEKIPVYIKLKSGEPFLLAGIYDFWKNSEGRSIGTCAVITTEANALIKNIHPRMPVIIRKEDHALWLDLARDDGQMLLPFLKPYDADAMEMYEVSPAVNSPKNEDASLIEPDDNTEKKLF
jgi:putative SOS response-associated peptidase YedK